ncbi:Linoleate 13S-lipoxygenase 2-1, chloroplastic [Vitis vinifera]|uniref:Linoleate 13S-lipoxygenase 2-1, chloroplastic n=1 Tax=Vitis vinifera TaxID=29760 RepID=A0A438JV18_VITVI|nr:Linoleate 13S-lipoxygenase 2-1, chloroplastic [Vitis vinifera]
MSSLSFYACMLSSFVHVKQSYLPSQTPRGLNSLREKDLSELARPVLGGSKKYPYPRRCRTGRPRSKIDPLSETRTGTFYVPRDEEFSEVKQNSFITKTAESVLDALLPSLKAVLLDDPVLRLVKAIEDADDVVKFETPAMFHKDKFSWLRDEEFSRQTLAGVNPYSIKNGIEEQLDPDVYGPPESAITTELVGREIKDFMTVDKALEQKKLFIIDYHDLLLPFVSKVRRIKGTTLYGSRALFFLTPDGTLKPLAIELTRPQWMENTVEQSFHAQFGSYRLRTHCATEPYIIATNRQLSVMHPIYRLLHPHCRYTMKINALARQVLISADGVIESSFSPSKYSMELSSVAYDQQWRFDREALPADLINRGIAIEDPTAPHGLKLLIADYPFANDEIRTKGHEDKKDEPWWPVLKTPEDLIGIITTIVWVASAHHSAVNFGQYAFAGYFPNRPTIARINMPCEDPTKEEWKQFPDSELLVCFPSQIQATKVMAILDVLSNHSPDEEYLGKHMEPTWGKEPAIKKAFERFSERLKELENIINARNKDNSLKNRGGAGVVPYDVLKPFSKQGVTGEGVPYSISI